MFAYGQPLVNVSQASCHHGCHPPPHHHHRNVVFRINDENGKSLPFPVRTMLLMVVCITHIHPRKLVSHGPEAPGKDRHCSHTSPLFITLCRVQRTPCDSPFMWLQQTRYCWPLKSHHLIPFEHSSGFSLLKFRVRKGQLNINWTFLKKGGNS